MDDIRNIICHSVGGDTKRYVPIDSIMPIGRFEVVDGEWRVVYDHGELVDNAARLLSDIPMNGEDARLLNGLGWWKVDRPGLLALAEELDGWALGPLPSTGMVGMWADSIRELCGEVNQ